MPFPPDPPLAWTTLSTDIVHRTPFIEIERNTVTRPDGNPGLYTLARFINRAVGVVPWENGGLWLVGQSRFTIGQYSWEIPEGGVPKDEDMEEAARRELKEETGITAETLTHLFDIHTSNSCTDEWGQAYLATGLTHGEAEPEATEDIQRLFVTLDEALAAVERGRITDALTIASLYKVALMRADGALP